MVIDFEELPLSFKDKLSNLPNDQLAEVLITGYDQENDHILFVNYAILLSVFKAAFSSFFIALLNSY